jgi:hypothetical protein
MGVGMAADVDGSGIGARLLAAVHGRRGVAAADELCLACVETIGVDAAAVSLIYDGAANATFGVSGPLAREYDELQFTTGEGPCLDSVASRAPVMVPDLAHPDETRWPAYRPALLSLDVRAVYAMPVLVAGEYLGALDLFCRRPGVLDADRLAGALVAADLVGLPMLDLFSADLDAAINDPESDAWQQLCVLTRAEVSQATGVVMAQLNVGPAEALVRLRAHAYATDTSATEVARAVLEQRLYLKKD